MIGSLGSGVRGGRSRSRTGVMGGGTWARGGDGCHSASLSEITIPGRRARRGTTKSSPVSVQVWSCSLIIWDALTNFGMYRGTTSWAHCQRGCVTKNDRQSVSQVVSRNVRVGKEAYRGTCGVETVVVNHLHSHRGSELYSTSTVSEGQH